ncbi:MAG: GNAT family N-acetyltransferase [Planctomycetes bacterium]|nr:GNAT family N-acetyltransferase [Planctomycetota bacterium]
MEAQQVTIRAATREDLEPIVRMNLLLAEETEGRTLDEAAVRDGVAAALADPQKGTYWLARLDERVVGQALVTTEWSDWRNGWFWWLQSVYVAKEHRRKGVLRALYRHVAHTARNRWDVCGLRLYVDRKNDAAQRAYAALGMATTDYLLLEHDWSQPR